MTPELRHAEFGFPRTDLRRRLVEAILRGEKTAGASLLSDYQREGGMPAVGERLLLVDERDQGVGIIEMTEVHLTTIAEVELAFALAEGEGFTSVADWRRAHERFWLSYADETRTWLNDPDWQPTDNTPIVCERFRLIDRFA